MNVDVEGGAGGSVGISWSFAKDKGVLPSRYFICILFFLALLLIMVSYIIGIVLLVFIGPFIYYRQSITSRKLWISKQLGVQTFLVYPSPAAYWPVQKLPIVFSYRRQNRHCKPYKSTSLRLCKSTTSVLIFLDPENAVSTRSLVISSAICEA